MKNNTNIYDIDGELIRAAGDNHKPTLQEIRDRIKYYTDKANAPDADPEKADIYASYIRNLTGYAMNLYSKMSPEELQEVFKTQATKQTTVEEIEKALNELKTDDGSTESSTVDEVLKSVAADTEDNTEQGVRNADSMGRGDGDIQETRSQSDLLVERDEPTIVMDEYAQFEEI